MAAQEEETVPAELQGCPAPALEGYVHSRIRRFNAQPALAQLLGPEAAAVLQQATQHLLAAQLPAAAGLGGGSGNSDVAASPRQRLPQQPVQLQLVFKHDCQHLGCADAHCQLCSQSQSRRCTRSFATKYLTGDMLKSACGALIRVELIDSATGRLVSEHKPMLLQMSIVDGRAYEAMVGAVPGGVDLDRITLLLNQQGQPLLTAKQGSSDSFGRVMVPLVKGCVLLPELCVAGSSEAMLSGQKPPFALLVQAVADGHSSGGGFSGDSYRADIPPLVSEGFVVATPRVRSATKKHIPRLTDHVSKLNAVGNATQSKLKDLRKAALEAGLHDLELPLAAANTVGDFRQLVAWAQEEPARCDQLKRMLKLTRGWEEACDHTLKAVGEDSRLRAFFPDDSLATGLLFACKDATPVLEGPLATLHEATDGSGRRTLRATLLHGDAEGQQAAAAAQQQEGVDGVESLQGTADQRQIKMMMMQAKACWSRRGHPGWALLPLDTAVFEHGCAHLHQVLLPAEVAAAAVPQAAHSSANFQPSAASPRSLATASLPALAGAQHLPSEQLLPVVAHEQQQQQQPAGLFAAGSSGMLVWPASPSSPIAAAAAAAAGVPSSGSGSMAAASSGSGSPTAAAAGSPRLPMLGSNREATPPEQLSLRQEFAGLGVQTPVTAWKATPAAAPQDSPPAAAAAAGAGAGNGSALQSPFQADTIPLSGRQQTVFSFGTTLPAGAPSPRHQPSQRQRQRQQRQQQQQQQPGAGACRGAVPLHEQISAQLAGRVRLGSSGSDHSTAPLPPSPFASGEASLTLPDTAAAAAAAADWQAPPGAVPAIVGMEAAAGAIPGSSSAGRPAATEAAAPASPAPPIFTFTACSPAELPTPAALTPHGPASAAAAAAPAVAQPAAVPVGLLSGPYVPSNLVGLPQAAAASISSAGGAPAEGPPPPPPAVVAKILSSLPSLSQFGSDGPLGVGAVAELDSLTAGASRAGAGSQEGARRASPVQPLRDMFIGGREGVPSASSVDWEQLLREAYKPDSGSGSPLPPEDALLPGRASQTPSPAAAAALAGSAGQLGAIAAAGGLAAAGEQLTPTLLKVFSHASVAAQEWAKMGTLSAMDWESILSDPSLSGLDHLLLPAGDPLLAGSAQQQQQARVPAQQRQLPRICTPEWARLLSLNAGDWAVMLQDAQQAQQVHQQAQQQQAPNPVQQCSATAVSPAAKEGGTADLQAPAAACSTAEMTRANAASGAAEQQQHSALPEARNMPQLGKSGRKRMLSPINSGMDGLQDA